MRRLALAAALFLAIFIATFALPTRAHADDADADETDASIDDAAETFAADDGGGDGAEDGDDASIDDGDALDETETDDASSADTQSTPDAPTTTVALPAAPQGQDGSCGCRVVGASTHAAPFAFSVVSVSLVALALLRRRRE